MRCLIPLTKLDANRAGAPVAWIAGRARQELAPHDGDLASRQVRPEAEVRARRAEAVVVVRGAAHVEDVGVGEDLLVAVGRAVEQEHLVAGLQVDARQRVVAAPACGASR